MSRKHNQRTRAEILARRSKPADPKLAPVANPIPQLATGGVPAVHPRAFVFLASLTHTAATRRAMRSKYMPHEGKQQR